MGLITITLLGMLCTPGQVPADVTPWNNTTMKIPIDYHPGKRGEIRELLLYVSADQGQTWQQHAVGVPDKDAFFTFTAPADGTYWFNMVVVEKSGRREPADIFKAAPALKVMFDTKKPVVNIASAQRVGDDVTVVWKVVEKNPDWSKFKLEYSTNGANWTPVSTRPEADGSAQFKVAGGGPLTVRVALTDLAGQVAEITSPVAGTAVAAKPMGELVTTGAELPAPPTPGLGTPSGIVVPPAISPIPGAPLGDRAKDPRFPNENKGTDTFPPGPGSPDFPRVSSADPSIIPPIGPTPKNDPLNVSTTAASNLPAAQVINVTSFKMAYEVEDKGASGVSKAEVYVTRDEGRTWRPWTMTEKPESPLMVDLAKNNNSQVEGVYGFKVLLHSGAGLSREAPKGGEAPDLRVDVDVTPPIVKIYEPVPDATQKDTMTLRWQAVDRNLANDPITLEWSDGPKGPWIPITVADTIGTNASVAKRLANSGSYAWKLPSNFPTHKVYLKVSARDVAGNVAEATTAQPILVDLNKPAAVKLNIVGAGN
ncbi:MAG: hypothetical protein EXS09_10780 [Gemmataceae bacterium]|nr:hypothetical protein [Gemmataceae bacterium]